MSASVQAAGACRLADSGFPDGEPVFGQFMLFDEGGGKTLFTFGDDEHDLSAQFLGASGEGLKPLDKFHLCEDFGGGRPRKGR